MDMKWQRAAGAIVLMAAATGVCAEETITLKLGYWVPPRHGLTAGYKEWGEALSKATHGTLKVQLYPSSQLGSGRDHYDMAKRGIADITLVNPGYTPGRFPVIGTVDLPFTVGDSLKAAPAITRWYRKYAAKEMSDVITCHAYTHDWATFHSNKPIRVPADIKGLNIRTANQTMSRYVTAMGGNPVQIPIMEAFESLKRGVTDGISVTLGGLTGPFKFGRVTKYTLDARVYVATFVHVINKAVYERMSPAQRKAIDDTCTPEWAGRVYKHWYDQDQRDQVNSRKLTNHVFTKVSPAELKLWHDAAKPVEKEWAESVRKAGYDPHQVLTELETELGKVGARVE